ncbi:AfsR/SARP family transcriptional regulator [Actinokineospora cianjurensis]|uniref:AfsR/SARP family transcriptional regulator n=1 Tax=Actinokineospora cianjurensis TaxID=585224 RepID=UPI000EB410FC|nr:AfsR/SARP family transcriptional regulator [Actinokineospora cianjurensis]
MAPVARKPRQILALLLLDSPRVVPTTTLIDELWTPPAPRTARAAVQVYVFELRKRLAEATGLDMGTVANEVLCRARNGYKFVAEPTWFDLRSFRERERAGLAALADGDLAKAAWDFKAALWMWSGPALAGVEPGPGIRAEVAGLEQSRATVLDQRIEVELVLGRHREILDELAGLAARDRFNEDLHAQFMVALYRCGHRTRALEVFHRLREDMVSRFGLEPSPRLYRCYQAALNRDPALGELPALLA